MKRKLILLLGISLLLLGGCSNKESTSVIFIDEYVLSLHTKNAYSKEENTSNLAAAIKDDLIGLYTIGKENTFNDSILVIKSPNTYNSLENFVDRNTEDISRPNYDEEKSKETSLDDCEKKIEMVVKKSLFEDEENSSYFVQSFFLTKDYAYLVSAATKDEDTYDQLYSDFKRISCEQ